MVHFPSQPTTAYPPLARNANDKRNRLFNFVVARATPVMLDTVGPHGYGTYFIFGSFCVCMVFVALFFVPETKGISLERMDELFGVANFGDIEDVGVAAQTGHLEKAALAEEGVHLEKA